MLDDDQAVGGKGPATAEAALRAFEPPKADVNQPGAPAVAAAPGIKLIWWLFGLQLILWVASAAAGWVLIGRQAEIIGVLGLFLAAIVFPRAFKSRLPSIMTGAFRRRLAVGAALAWLSLYVGLGLLLAIFGRSLRATPWFLPLMLGAFVVLSVVIMGLTLLGLWIGSRSKRSSKGPAL